MGYSVYPGSLIAEFLGAGCAAGGGFCVAPPFALSCARAREAAVFCASLLLDEKMFTCRKGFFAAVAGPTGGFGGEVLMTSGCALLAGL